MGITLTQTRDSCPLYSGKMKVWLKAFGILFLGAQDELGDTYVWLIFLINYACALAGQRYVTLLQSIGILDLLSLMMRDAQDQ